MGFSVEARPLVRYSYVDAAVSDAVGVAPVQQDIGPGYKHGAAQSSSSKARKAARKRVNLSTRSRHITNARDSGARNTPPLPRHERAANPQTKKESGAQPPKVVTDAAVEDFRDQCTVATPDQAADSASAPAPELPSHSTSAPVTGRRRTRSMEANGRGSKKTRVAKASTPQRRSSAHSELPACSSAKRQTPNFASSGAITELDQGLAHIGAMAQECHVGGPFAPAYSFDNAAENILEDEDDPYNITMASEDHSILYVGPEEPEAAVFPKRPLPDTCIPPIWAQVGR